MTTPYTQHQLTAQSALFAGDLAQKSVEDLINLCLLYRNHSDLRPTFKEDLEAELKRRFTPEMIQEDPSEFAVLHNFLRQFKSNLPYYQSALLQMKESINRDLWFQSNEAVFRAALEEPEVVAWLLATRDVLRPALNNAHALRMMGESAVFAEALLSHATAYHEWQITRNVWDVWVQTEAGMQTIARSRDLMADMLRVPAAITAFTQHHDACTIMAQSAFFSLVLDSVAAMGALVQSEAALEAIWAVKPAWALLLKHRAAFTAFAGSTVAVAGLKNSLEKYQSVLSVPQTHSIVRESLLVQDLSKNSLPHLLAYLNPPVTASDQVALFLALNLVPMPEALNPKEVTDWSQVANQQNLMTALAGSSVAMSAIAQSSTAMSAIAQSSTARNALMQNNTFFQNQKSALHAMVGRHWQRVVFQKQDSVANANPAMANPAGLVFATLGRYGNSNATTTMLHPDSTIAHTAGTAISPSSLSPVDAVSFNGATFTEKGDGYVFCELWAPR